MSLGKSNAPATGWCVLEQQPGLLQVGDIIQVYGSGLLPRLIRRFTRRREEGPTWASHTAMVLTADPAVILIEARLQVGVRTLAAYGRTRQPLVIHRIPDGLTTQQERDLCTKALDYEGRWYGFLKLFAHAFDYAIGGVYLFRRLARSDRYPICSWVVAYVYQRKLGLKFGVEPNAASPDDILDYCVQEGWQLVWADSQKTADDFRKTYELRREAKLKAAGKSAPA